MLERCAFTLPLTARCGPARSNLFADFLIWRKALLAAVACCVRHSCCLAQHLRASRQAARPQSFILRNGVRETAGRSAKAAIYGSAARGLATTCGCCQAAANHGSRSSNERAQQQATAKQPPRGSLWVILRTDWQQPVAAVRLRHIAAQGANQWRARGAQPRCKRGSPAQIPEFLISKLETTELSLKFAQNAESPQCSSFSADWSIQLLL